MLLPAVPRLITTTLAALLLVSCAKQPTNVERGFREQVLHLGNLSDPRDLDPHHNFDDSAFYTTMALFEGLVNFDPIDLHPVPGVAERWEVSPDGLVWTFHLRANARWSNGDPVTAEDFVFSARRMCSAALGAEYSYLFHVLRGARDYLQGRQTDFAKVGVKAPDAGTVRYELEHPCPYFLTLLAHIAWFPVHAPTVLKAGRIDEPYTGWSMPGKLVGNGPFALVSWRQNQELIVRKNPYYWDAARVQLQEIHYHPIESSEVEERAFRTGQLQLTYDVPANKIDLYRRTQPTVLLESPWYQTRFISFNLAGPPFNDPRVRLAFGLAADRTQLANFPVPRLASAAPSASPPGFGYNYRGPAAMGLEVERARHLLAEAGYPDGRGFPRVEFRFDASDRSHDLAQALQEMWRKNLGVQVALASQENRLFFTSLNRGEYQFALDSYFGDYGDPNTFLSLWLTGAGNNHPRYANPAYDRLIDEANHQLDPAHRFALLADAETLLLTDAPVAPLLHEIRFRLRHPSVRGWHGTLLEMHPLQDVRLDPP